MDGAHLERWPRFLAETGSLASIEKMDFKLHRPIYISRERS